jgi:hypothetical protein
MPAARALSILGHPAVLVPLAVAASAHAQMASTGQIRNAVLECCGCEFNTCLILAND